MLKMKQIKKKCHYFGLNFQLARKKYNKKIENM